MAPQEEMRTHGVGTESGGAARRGGKPWCCRGAGSRLNTIGDGMVLVRKEAATKCEMGRYADYPEGDGAGWRDGKACCWNGERRGADCQMW